MKSRKLSFTSAQIKALKNLPRDLTITEGEAAYGMAYVCSPSFRL